MWSFIKRLTELDLAGNVGLERIRVFLYSPISFLAISLLPPISAVFLWKYISHDIIIYWLIFAYLAMAIRLITWRRLRAIAESNDLQLIKKRLWNALGGMFISGISWGLFATFINLTDDLIAINFIVIVAMGVSVGAVLTTATWLPATLFLALPMISSLLINTLLRREAYFIIVFVGIVMFAVLIISFIRNYTEWLNKFVRLQMSNAQLVEDLTVARDAATAASVAKSKFLASMSHELRTPLNSILGFSEILKDSLIEDITPQSTKEYASYIYESGDYLLQIINNILDFSKIEAGKTELNYEKFSVRSLIGDCASMLSPMAAKNEITIQFNLNEVPDLIIDGDEVRMRQILINLISNSLKFSPKGAIVQVGASASDGDFVKFYVRDNGIGMTQEELKVALEPFGQVAGMYKAGLVGTGLGLPLSKSLAELHGGRLEVDTKKGAGTTVYVYIPMKKTPRVISHQSINKAGPS